MLFRLQKKDWLLLIPSFFNVLLIGCTTNSLIGETAPNFELFTLKGDRRQLTDYRGKIIVLDFWATWSAESRPMIMNLIGLERKYRQETVAVIGVAVDTETRGKVFATTQNYRMYYDILTSNDEALRAVQDLYGGREAINTTFIIDKDGVVRLANKGYTPRDMIEKIIEKLQRENVERDAASR